MTVGPPRLWSGLLCGGGGDFLDGLPWSLMVFGDVGCNVVESNGRRLNSSGGDASAIGVIGVKIPEMLDASQGAFCQG